MYTALYKKITGFGMTKDEAEYDAKLNCYCSSTNIDMQSNPEWIERYSSLAPWRPLPNSLHICEVGYLEYIKERNVILEHTSGVEVEVTNKGYSIPLYVHKLLGDKVTYTDIMIILRDTLTDFFRAISEEFVPLKDYESPRMLSFYSDDIKPEIKCVYSMDSGVDIIELNSDVGLKRKYDDDIYLIAKQSDLDEDVDGLLSLLHYRMNSFSYDGGDE